MKKPDKPAHKLITPAHTQFQWFKKTHAYAVQPIQVANSLQPLITRTMSSIASERARIENEMKRLQERLSILESAEAIPVKAMPFPNQIAAAENGEL